MAYTEEILTRARAKLEARQKTHRQEREALREQVFRAIPRTREIDRQLRRTSFQVMALSLRKGMDGPASLAALREENLGLQDEEARLLYEGGFPDDALVDTPLCPLCNDQGWQGSKMCSCLRELCRQEQIKSLSSLLDLGNQSFETFRLDYYDRTVWPEHKRSPREIMEVIFTTCRNYADQFPGYHRKNLFLTGAPGLGKTFLSACIARVVSEKGFSVVYDTAGNIFSRFEAKKFARNEEEVQAASADTRRYLRCDLLILDDLGSEFTTPFVQSALYEIVNTRLVEGKHTILSSNLSLADIRRRYSPQVASRLEGEYQLLPFVGQDIRQMKRN